MNTKMLIKTKNKKKILLLYSAVLFSLFSIIGPFYYYSSRFEYQNDYKNNTDYGSPLSSTNKTNKTKGDDKMADVEEKEIMNIIDAVGCRICNSNVICTCFCPGNVDNYLELENIVKTDYEKTLQGECQKCDPDLYCNCKCD